MLGVLLTLDVLPDDTEGLLDILVLVLLLTLGETLEEILGVTEELLVIVILDETLCVIEKLVDTVEETLGDTEEL